MIDDQSDQEGLKITYNTGPGIEVVQKEFEDILQELQKNNPIIQPSVINPIKPANELPTEVCSSKCPESLKGSYKINAAIKALQQKYKTIIKNFDTNKPGKVNVTYWKVELPEGQAPTDEAPDWEYVRNLVEGSMPHQIQFKLFRQGDTDSQGLEEKVVK